MGHLFQVVSPGSRIMKNSEGRLISHSFLFTNLTIHTYFLHLHPIRVRSLLGLLTGQDFGDLIDATLTDEDPYTKVVDFVVEFNSHNSLF